MSRPDGGQIVSHRLLWVLVVGVARVVVRPFSCSLVFGVAEFASPVCLALCFSARVRFRSCVCSPGCLFARLFPPVVLFARIWFASFLFVTGLRLGEEQIKMEIRAGKLELSFDFPAPHI